MNLNKVLLAGRLTRDPEMQFASNGEPWVRFSIAINEYSGAKEGEGKPKENTTFLNCVAWNRGKYELARIIAENFHKGSEIYVEGKIVVREWEGTDGQKRKTTEVRVSEFQFVGSKSAGGGGAAAAEPPADTDLLDV
jgi:single-strand DNA-binding protein